MRMLRSPLFCAGLVIGVACGVFASGQGTAPVATQKLYLLAGTTTNDGANVFPVSLYQVNANTKLELVREVVPEKDGLFEVHSVGDVLFVLYPHVTPTAVSLVHFDNPARPDDVTFNPEGLFVLTRWVVAAQPTGQAPEELIPHLGDAFNLGKPDKLPDINRGIVISVSSESSVATPRVRPDAWEDYAELHLDGDPGGPEPTAGFFGSTVGDNLTISIFGHTVVVGALPPSLKGTKNVGIIAASQKYLILSDVLSMRELSALNSRKLFVRDRVRNVWKTIQIVGNGVSCRLFDDWLASRVGIVSPNQKASPGRDNERDFETERLPNVQEEYESYSTVLRSGTQVLQNLEDGRIVRIETGQEDSEILSVEGDVVLYRVNDAIYQAKIVGGKLQASTVLVKDEDVPEIHWVFWGPQTR